MTAPAVEPSPPAGLDFAAVDHLTGGRLGVYDVACPCRAGAAKRIATKRVLRVWRQGSQFASYYCARCGERGWLRDGSAPRRKIDRAQLARAAAEMAERDRAHKAERLSKARWLWSVRMPIAGTIAETYLREARGCGGPRPTTLGFLPARGKYPPAMIAAFGLARETEEAEPGVLAIADDAVRGVHLTRLLPDGSGKAVFNDPEENAKIMVGRSTGWPIVIAPPNDLLGLAITEGIEDGLSVHEATGLGAWAAGSASRMPALAERVPSYVEAVTVFAHDDDAGQKGARQLAGALVARGFAVRVDGLDREEASS